MPEESKKVVRYKAPRHVTAVHTGAGSHYVADKDDVIEVPQDAPSGDHVALCAAGWTPIADEKPAPDEAKAAAPAASAPVKSA
jgi:hypothetical protein